MFLFFSFTSLIIAGLTSYYFKNIVYNISLPYLYILTEKLIYSLSYIQIFCNNIKYFNNKKIDILFIKSGNIIKFEKVSNFDIFYSSKYKEIQNKIINIQYDIVLFNYFNDKYFNLIFNDFNETKYINTENTNYKFLNIDLIIKNNKYNITFKTNDYDFYYTNNVIDKHFIKYYKNNFIKKTKKNKKEKNKETIFNFTLNTIENYINNSKNKVNNNSNNYISKE